MTKSEIKKYINKYLKDNFEGQKFFRINMSRPICLNKFIHSDINFYESTMESGIFDSSKTEFNFKSNSFNKDSINVEVVLNNSDYSVINRIHLSISSFKDIDIASIPYMITANLKAELEKVFNEQLNLTKLSETNKDFASNAIKLVNDKIDSINQYKENCNNIEKDQARLLLEYYNMLIEDYLNCYA